MAIVDLKKIRAGIATLSKNTTASVAAVRSAFSAGLVPAQTVNSGSVADFVDRIGSSVGPVDFVTPSVRIGLQSSIPGTIVVPTRPHFDSVELKFDAGGGLDTIACELVFSLDESEFSHVKHLEIFRARVGKLDAPPLKFSAASLLNHSTRKNNDPYAVSIFRNGDLGTKSELVQSIKDDPYARQRAAITTDSPTIVGSTISTNKIMTVNDLTNIPLPVDVADDITTYINKRTTTITKPLSLPLELGGKSGVNVLKSDQLSSELKVVEPNNAVDAKCIMTVSSAKFDRTVGRFLEYRRLDTTVTYGGRYIYYIVAVDELGGRSLRSRVLVLDAISTSAPPTPDVVYSIVDGTVRFNIICNGRNPDHVEIFRRLGPDIKHYADVKLGQDGSISFVDRRVRFGQTIEYRIFTVDAFGKKSPIPFVGIVTVPEAGAFVPLKRPTITAEQLNGRAVKIKVVCDDPRVTVAFVSRRDETIGGRYFTAPNQPEESVFGLRAKSLNSRSGPHIVSDATWTGMLRLTSGSAEMIDRALMWDHSYKYACDVVDRHGHRSDAATTELINISSRPTIVSPVEVSATRSTTGVVVRWTGGALDVPPVDMIGDQDALVATEQRTLYQVERRTVGAGIGWQPLLIITGSSFVDRVETTAVSPDFRPPYATVSQEYEYRVIAMQSGGFISTYSDSARISTAVQPSAVESAWARSPAAILPTTVVVSWMGSADAVDGWEIERAAANRIYGSQIVSVDSEQAANLAYTSIGKIPRESSRSLSREVDGSSVDKTVYVGDRWYIDSAVDRMNTYFYRIRAVNGSLRSPWKHVGMKFVDPVYEMKLTSTITRSTVTSLSLDPRPVLKGIV